MQEATRAKCVIDDSPHGEEISGWLRQGLTATAVNAHLKAIDPDVKGYSPSMYSRHRTICLGMAKLAKGRVEKKKIDQNAKNLEQAGVVTNDDILQLSKTAFFDRLKRNPSDITTKDLVSVIGALSRGKTEADPMDALTQAMGDISG